MQFVSGIYNLQCLLVLVAIFVTGSNALRCTTCLDRGSCANRPETQECNNDLVTLHHRLLWSINPNLAVPPTNANVFKCYDLDMSYQSPLSGARILVNQKGCTYYSTNFCDGWDDTSAVNRCVTCDSGDDCNKGQTEGTATPTPEAPTTTTGAADETSVSPNSPTTSATTTDATTTTVVNPPTSSTTTEATTTTVTNSPTTSSSTTEATTTTVNSPTTSSTTTEATTTTVVYPTTSSSTTTEATTTTVVYPPTSSSTTTEATTTTVTNSPTTSSSTSVTTAKPVTTTVKPAGASNLGCWMNWPTIVGFALLHGLIARW